MKRKISGIYCYENLVNRKKYIGQSNNIAIRKSSHLYVLKSEKYNDSKLLQRAWNKYGEGNFEFWIVEECSIELLDEREKYWIKELRSHCSEHGYNMNWGGECFLGRGVPHTEEHKKKAALSLIMSTAPRSLVIQIKALLEDGYTKKKAGLIVGASEGVVRNVARGFYKDIYGIDGCDDNPVIRCEKCNKLVKRTGRHQTMCDKCWHIRKNELQRKLMARKRRKCRLSE
jgi:hypothetical protein